MRLMRPLPPNPRLDALLEKSRNHVMTPEEMAAQRRSWVTGEMMLSDDQLTKEEADRRFDDMMRRQGYNP